MLSHHARFNENMIETSIQEYLQFLRHAGGRGRTCFNMKEEEKMEDMEPPSLIVDAIWHVHMQLSDYCCDSVRLAGRIVGHIEIAPRTVMIGAAPVKAAALDRVAILPECRGAGHGQRLVQAAERRMRELGVVAAFSRTRIASSFHDLGWSVLGRDCASPGRDPR